jgi:hypothetical protein
MTPVFERSERTSGVNGPGRAALEEPNPAALVLFPTRQSLSVAPNPGQGCPVGVWRSFVAVSRVEEITLGVVCAAIVHSLIFPKSAFSAFEEKLRRSMAEARRWIADSLVHHATPRAERELPDRRRHERALFAGHKLALRHLGTSSQYQHDPCLRPQARIAPAFSERRRGSSDRIAVSWAA